MDDVIKAPKIIKIPLRVNSKNGQISSWWKKTQLPSEVTDAIKQQPGSIKKFLIEFKGWE